MKYSITYFSHHGQPRIHLPSMDKSKKYTTSNYCHSHILVVGKTEVRYKPNGNKIAVLLINYYKVYNNKKPAILTVINNRYAEIETFSTKKERDEICTQKNKAYAAKSAKEGAKELEKELAKPKYQYIPQSVYAKSTSQDLPDSVPYVKSVKPLKNIIASSKETLDILNSTEKKTLREFAKYVMAGGWGMPKPTKRSFGSPSAKNTGTPIW